MGVFLASIFFISSCSDDPEVFNPQEQYATDLEFIQEYLSNNNIQAEIDSTTGIYYVVEEQGTGLAPYLIRDVTLSYTGTVLSTGEQYTQLDSQRISMSSLINGLQIAMTKIQEGGSFTAYIPSFYAFGPTGSSNVPPNSVIMIEAELYTYHAEQIKADVQAIDDSLAAWGIQATQHPSGIRYVLNQGTGNRPFDQSRITVDYTGRLLGEETPFDEGTNVTFTLSNLITGWRVMLPLVREGGEITMYLPSSYGYGSQGTNGIPPDANLEFDITLQQVQ